MEPISIVKVNSLEEEYKYLMEELKEMDNYIDIAILYRNNISAIGVIEYLERNNIPFYIKDTNAKFFNHWILQDIINFSYYLMIIQICNPLKGYTIKWMDLFLKIKLIILKP